MNFSEPGCVATTTTINSSTPLDLARSLFSDMAYPTTISDFARHLTAFHDAAYLLLLPQTCPAEISIRQAETSRISTGPSRAAVLQATTLIFLLSFRQNTELARTQHEDIYEATGCMLRDLFAEEERHLSNMALLLAELKRKWKNEFIETGRFVLHPLPSSPNSTSTILTQPPFHPHSWHRTASTMGKTGIASARALADLVGDRATAPYRATYLGEIARYWRKWTGVGTGIGTGVGEARVYEEVWSYVAGRALVQE